MCASSRAATASAFSSFRGEHRSSCSTELSRMRRKTPLQEKKPLAQRNQKPNKKIGYLCCAPANPRRQRPQLCPTQVPALREAALPRALSVEVPELRSSRFLAQFRRRRPLPVGCYHVSSSPTFRVLCATMPVPLICMS